MDDLDKGIARARCSRGIAALWAAAAVVIGHALEISRGDYGDGSGLKWITVGIIFAWAGVLLRSLGLEPGTWKWLALAVCMAGICWELVELSLNQPVEQKAVPAAFNWIALPSIFVLAAGAVFWDRWSRRLTFPLFLAAYFVVGVAMLRFSPQPFIDVWEMTKDACQAISQGHNPYAIDFPDVYVAHPDWEKAFYAYGYVYGGRAHFGYVYMPLSFFVAYAGHLIADDFRVGNLMALTGAAALLGYARSGRLAVAAAILMLLTPRVFFVLDMGWAEPVVLVCLAGVVFCACRAPQWLGIAIGLLIASKQHMPLVAPAAILLLPQPWTWKALLRLALVAAATWAVVSLPLMMWDFKAFWRSAVAIQLADPFRADSLNYAAWWVQRGGSIPPQWLAFVLAIAAVGVTVWRAPRSPAGFAGAVAVIYLCFFALAKQAFCNYYFMALGALCCAAAVAGKEAGDEDLPQSRLVPPA